MAGIITLHRNSSLFPVLNFSIAHTNTPGHVLSAKYIHHNWLHTHYLYDLYLERGESPDIWSLVWTSTDPGLAACMKLERLSYETSGWTGRNKKAVSDQSYYLAGVETRSWWSNQDSNSLQLLLSLEQTYHI